GVAAHRAPWLLAQLAIACSFALVLLHDTSSQSVLPAIELPVTVAPIAPAAIASPPSAAIEDKAIADALASDTPGVATPGVVTPGVATPQPVGALVWAAHGWLAVYLCGLAWAAIRWLRARRHLKVLIRASHRLDPALQASHPAFLSLRRRLPEIREVDAPVSPMLLGLIRPVLLLPRHLRDFDVTQQRLVLEHELTHLARRDQLWLHLGCLLQMLLWFNPAVALLRRQLVWAQELGCDRAVLSAHPVAQRRHYAAALVAQMRVQQAPGPFEALAFGGRMFDSVSARIGMIRDGVPVLPKAAAQAMPLLAVLGMTVGVFLQPVFAWHIPALPVASLMPAVVASPPTTPSPLPRWSMPVERVRISGFFGVRSALLEGSHGGMDFAAPRGTPVMAVAPGTVVVSTKRYKGQSQYGETIAIDHADGLQSVYAHLDTRAVKPGDKIVAGQVIGASGATGKVTGPHLHLEVLQNGTKIDPQRLLGDLASHGTKNALRARKLANA
ncbi:MAG: M23/M56 family metallopeptidase, partial [Duganella sp.]